VPEPAAVAETIREAKPLRMSAHSCVVSALVVGATLLVDAFGDPAAVSLDVVAGATVEEVAEAAEEVAGAAEEVAGAAEEVAGAAEPVSVVETTGAFDVVASEDGDVVSAFATGTSVIVPATAAASDSPAMRLTLEFEAIITSRM